MLGYIAVFEPLALGTYRFQLKLTEGQQGVSQDRTVVDQVVEDVDLVDVEMTFIGHLVSGITKGGVMRWRQ